MKPGSSAVASPKTIIHAGKVQIDRSDVPLAAAALVACNGVPVASTAIATIQLGKYAMRAGRRRNPDVRSPGTDITHHPALAMT